MTILTNKQLSFETAQVYTKYMGKQAQDLYSMYPKLFVLMDTLKIMGFNVYESYSSFVMFVMREVASGALMIAKDDMDLLFITHWSDPFVHLVPNAVTRKYVHSEVDVFTPSRVEFGLYEDGFLDSGAQRTLLQKHPDLEDFQNFIVACYLPNVFYINVDKKDIVTTFDKGTMGRIELFSTPQQAEDQRKKTEFRLLVVADGLELKQLYTDTLTGSQCGSRRHCIYYDLPINEKHIKISD